MMPPAGTLRAPRPDLLQPAEVARLGGLEVVTEGIVEGFLAGLHRSPRRGFSVEFAEHRQYQPGDDPRYVDWKLLGRTDRLYLKQFEEETNLRAMLVVDASASMAWRGAPERLTKLDYATRLAAALAMVLLRQRDATGLVTFDETVPRDAPRPRPRGTMADARQRTRRDGPRTGHRRRRRTDAGGRCAPAPRDGGADLRPAA
ncbi:MAG: DUF58 domain-containing protein [Gemmatimonadales bacterium]